MKNHTKKLPMGVEQAKRRGAGLASTTKGRARSFTNRKKQANRNACRGQS